MRRHHPRDGVRRLSAVEALARDIDAALSRQVNICEFWADLGRAKALVEERGEAAQRITLVHLFIKAAALAVLACPELHRMYGRYRVLEPAHVDVGVSVEAGTIFAPVVVIEDADRKSLDVIARELRERSRQARSNSARLESVARRYVRLVPLRRLRQALIRAYLASPARRRRAVGSIQISSLERFDLDAATTPVVGELLLTCGAVGSRMVGNDLDDCAVRTGAEFRLIGSHRKLNGDTAGRFIERFRHLLANPEELA